MKKPLLNIIFAVLGVSVFYFLAHAIYKNWRHIENYDFHFNVYLLVIASLVYVATMVIFALGWWIILKYFKYKISFIDTFLYFLITQPAKYIPGKVWIGITRMKFCKPHGIPNSVTFLTTGMEGIMEIFAGAYISIIAFTRISFSGRFSHWAIFIISALGIILMVPKIFYFFINAYLKLVKHPPIKESEQASFVEILSLQAVYILSLLALGVSHVLLLESFAPVSPIHYPFIISITAFSYVAGIIAIFAPSGLGVRESIWHFALKKITAPHTSIIFAFLSRLWMIVIEAILLAIAIPILWIKNSAARKRGLFVNKE